MNEKLQRTLDGRRLERRWQLLFNKRVIRSRQMVDRRGEGRRGEEARRKRQSQAGVRRPGQAFRDYGCQQADPPAEPQTKGGSTLR